MRYLIPIAAALLAGLGMLGAAQPATRSAKSVAPAKTTAKKGTTAKGPASKAGAAKAGAAKGAVRTTAKATASKGSSAGKTAAKSTSKKSAAKTTATNYHRSLQQQPTTDRYREIQQALSDKGYFGGTVDGNWGPDSVDALKRFQHDQNLTDDGKIGSLSLIALGLGPKRDAPAAPPDRSAP